MAIKQRFVDWRRERGLLGKKAAPKAVREARRAERERRRAEKAARRVARAARRAEREARSRATHREEVSETRAMAAEWRADGDAVCAHCAADISHKRRGARFCSNACRQAAYRWRRRDAAELAARRARYERRKAIADALRLQFDESEGDEDDDAPRGLLGRFFNLLGL